MNKLASLAIDQFHDLFVIFKQKGDIPPTIGGLKDFLLSQIQVINANAKGQTKKKIYDEIHAKELFLHLDELARNPNLKFNQIKIMRKQILGAILNKDPLEIHKVELKITKLKKKILGD